MTLGFYSPPADGLDARAVDSSAGVGKVQIVRLADVIAAARAKRAFIKPPRVTPIPRRLGVAHTGGDDDGP